MRLRNGQLRNLLFIDIETAPYFAQHDALDETMQDLWAHKHQLLRIEDETPAESYEKRAGIYAEFGRVICISLGYFKYDRATDSDTFRVKSFSGENEHALLEEFCALINRHFNDGDHYQFCGHNIREFDVPYLCRRLLINQLSLPNLLDISGRKPWETNSIDTLHLWRFGDYKNYTSLKLLAHVLGIPSPKYDIDGSDVARLYYHEHDLPRIVAYCQRDVVTVARLLLKFRGEPTALNDEDIVIVT